jgi:hypothetical protein
MHGKSIRYFISYAIIFACLVFNTFIISADTITISTIPYGKIIALEDAPIRYFTVSTSGTYIIETGRPGQNGLVQDTVIKLYDSSNNFITSADDINGATCQYSRISTSLSAGIYKVVVYRYPTQTDDIACYLSIYKDNTLWRTDHNYPAYGYEGYSGNTPYQSENSNIPYTTVYSNLTYTFKYLSSWSANYNCLAYALGITNQYIWPWETETPLASEVSTFFTYNANYDDRGIKTAKYYTGHTYTQYASTANGRIAFYTTNGRANHFSVIDGIGCKAKMGQLERVSHDMLDAYYSYSSYGSLYPSTYFG